MESKSYKELKQEKWQGKFLKQRWDDENLDNDCFQWMTEWKTAPTYTIAGLQELYQQLLPTKVYHQRKTGTNTTTDVTCRMCGKVPETIEHVMAGCSALAQTKYLARHNAALKILYFELLTKYDLAESIPPWYSPKEPDPITENNSITAYWDVPVFAENKEVRANRIDARIVDKVRKEILLLEMSCPWITNRRTKEEEKTRKYAPLRWELKQQYPGYEIKQVNIIIARCPWWVFEGSKH